MRPVLTRLTPARGYSQFLHYIFLVMLPLLVLILVRLQAVQGLAFFVVILAKWRMLAVRPRFWLANIRANAVDIIVGLSVVVFMMHAGNGVLQLLWAALYAIWLIGIKPRSTILWVAAQAAIGQAMGLSALYTAGAGTSLLWLTLLAGLICYLAARHFFDSYDESYARLLSYLWGYFAASLAWLLGHWLLFYLDVAQPTVLLSVIGYGLAILYYFDHHDRLTPTLRKQVLFAMLAIILVVLSFSDWGDKVV